MKTVRIVLLIMIAVGLVLVSGCKTEEASADAPAAGAPEAAAEPAAEPAAASTPKLSAADNPKAGDSCEGLDASKAAMACDGAKQIFCSSHTSYKWEVTLECESGQKCVVAEDGKSASCQ